MRSGARTRKSRSNRLVTGSHEEPDPGWPWSSTTAGPDPRSMEASIRGHRLPGEVGHHGDDRGLVVDDRDPPGAGDRHKVMCEQAEIPSAVLPPTAALPTRSPGRRPRPR